MDEFISVTFLLLLAFAGMFFVLYTGDSTFKHSGKTLKQTIDDWWSRVTRAYESQLTAFQHPDQTWVSLSKLPVFIVRESYED